MQLRQLFSITALLSLGILLCPSFLYAQDSLEDKIRTAKRQLELMERVYGPDNFAVADPLNSLAGLYQAQGKYSEAEPLSKRSLGIWEKSLGPEHPDVAKVLDGYAQLLRKLRASPHWLDSF